jgi:hypothetical protein
MSNCHIPATSHFTGHEAWGFEYWLTTCWRRPCDDGSLVNIWHQASSLQDQVLSTNICRLFGRGLIPSTFRTICRNWSKARHPEFENLPWYSSNLSIECWTLNARFDIWGHGVVLPHRCNYVRAWGTIYAQAVMIKSSCALWTFIKIRRQSGNGLPWSRCPWSSSAQALVSRLL